MFIRNYDSCKEGMSDMKIMNVTIAYWLSIVCTGAMLCAPVITSITPSNGSVVGGNVISIKGTGFTGTTAVNFGFRPATMFTFISDTLISAVVPAGTAGTVDVTVKANGRNSALTRSDFYTYTQNSWTGIVSSINQDAIVLFDTATNTITGIINLFADSLSAVPDGTRIYAADSTQPLVNVIDVATSAIIANISTPVAGAGSFDIIVSPDGSRVYVSNILSGYVTEIDTVTNTVVTDIFVGAGLGALSITPDGKTVYVSNVIFGNVYTIDTATYVVNSIVTGAVPGMIAITPDGTTAYVANSGSDTISIIDVATQSNTGTINFPAGSGPYGSFILPNSTYMYVANINNSTVSVVDLSTNLIVGSVPYTPATEPFWVVATPDSKKVFVINQITDDVTPIDVATTTTGASFGNIGGDVQDITMSQDPAPVAVFVTKMQPAGTPTVFDASASISPIGTITTYAWDFGDGVTLTTNVPVVNHTYTSAGSFTVTLTVTNSAGTSTTKVFSSRFMSNNGGPNAILSQTFPAAPSDGKGCQLYSWYLTQSDIVNVVTWKAPAFGEPPAAYYIYRDILLTDLIAIIPANKPLIFQDHNRTPNTIYTYYITSVSSQGLASSYIAITVNPKC